MNRILLEYNYNNILSTLDAINELSDFSNTDRLICLSSVSDSISPTLTSFADLEQKCYSSNTTTDSTGIYRITDRINEYLILLANSATHLTTILEEIFITNKQLTSLVLDTAVLDFHNELQTFSLTEYSRYSSPTFNILSDMFDVVYRQLCNDNTSTVDTPYKIDTIDTIGKKNFYSYLVNGQNIYLNNDNLQNLKILAGHDRLTEKGLCLIAQSNDIYVMLDKFINRLKNYKRAIFYISEYQTDVQTRMSSSGKKITELNASNTGKTVQIFISPYYMNVGSIQDTILENTSYKELLQTPTKYLNSDGKNVIDLTNVIYDMSSHSSSPSFIPEDQMKTNGILSRNLTIQHLDTFDLSINDVCKLYQLTQKNIMSRKHVLQAITYIFNYWLEHMSKIVYNINLCHINCHNNNYDPPVYGENKFSNSESTRWVQTEIIPLRLTDGCGCYEILSNTASLNSLVPLASSIPKVDPAETITIQCIGKLYWSCKVGSYSETKSPSQLTINGGGTYTVDWTGIGAQTVYKTETTCSFNTGSYTLTATPYSSTKRKEQCFCIGITLYGQYKIKRILESES